jgi:hypothetical protein
MATADMLWARLLVVVVVIIIVIVIIITTTTTTATVILTIVDTRRAVFSALKLWSGLVWSGWAAKTGWASRALVTNNGCARCWSQLGGQKRYPC